MIAVYCSVDVLLPAVVYTNSIKLSNIASFALMFWWRLHCHLPASSAGTGGSGSGSTTVTAELDLSIILFIDSDAVRRQNRY